jgi:hypothetical protein
VFDYQSVGCAQGLCVKSNCEIMLEVIEDGAQMYLPYKLHINFIKTSIWLCD